MFSIFFDRSVINLEISKTESFQFLRMVFLALSCEVICAEYIERCLVKGNACSFAMVVAVSSNGGLYEPVHKFIIIGKG